MEHTKKMLLVDPKILDSHKPNMDEKVNSINNMSQQITSIVNDDDDDDNLYERLNELNQVLFRYLRRMKQVKNNVTSFGAEPLDKIQSPPPVKVNKTVEFEREVIDGVSNVNKKKADALLKKLKNNPDVQWTENGEISYRGNTITGSSMVDLMNEALKKNKSEVKPRGWSTFSLALKDMDIPGEFINNSKRSKTRTWSSPVAKKKQKWENID